MLSETAGQATHGTALEPVARIAGALGGNLGNAAAAAHADAPTRTVAAAARGVTGAEFDAARRLQETGARLGVPLTGPEAIQAATGGATKLGDVLRVVEGSTQGGATTARFFANRPSQVRGAAGRAFDEIAPQSAEPSTLGPRAAAAAQAEIDETAARINAATQPDYEAAGQHVLDPADFAPIADDPAFQASLRRLRADEVLGPTYRDLPDNSVAVIDAVTKQMRDRGTALGNSANPGFSSQASGRYSRGATEARDIARDPARGGVQAYDDALTAQAQARRQNLEPLEQGPVGRLAAASDTVGAGETVLPTEPHVGGEREIADAVGRIAAREPDVTAQLVRQVMADRFDRSAGRLVGGENQYGGARYAKDVAGTEAQDATLRAVVEVLDRPAAPAAVSDLLDVFRATGTRKAQGSPTEFNRQTAAEIGERPVMAQALDAVRSGGASVLTHAGDASKRAWLGKNTGTLADMFIAPDSVDRIAAIIARGAGTPFADALRQSALQAPAAVQ